MLHRTDQRAGLMLAGTALGVLLLAGCGGGVLPGGTSPTTVPTTAKTTTTTAPSTLSAPQTRQPHIMEFTATGSAKISSISYVIDGQTTTVPPTTLPWHQTVNIPADGANHNYEVDVNYGYGDIDILAILDGQTQDSSTGSASGSGSTAQLQGSFVG
ncbi:MAG TPA: hypothetical protein VG247_31855 [Pseudonocardiaceae bacterium]|jgi:hypothetical protein|nr:hypothetical protein [Pseudonocardiaceae bacterium]